MTELEVLKIRKESLLDYLEEMQDKLDEDEMDFELDSLGKLITAIKYLEDRNEK